MIWKSTLREIRSSLGRYLAIMAIVALGVGFFAGLKVTKEDMIDTADRYLKEKKLFDFEMFSSLGFDDESIKIIEDTDGVRHAEGSISKDMLVVFMQITSRYSKYPEENLLYIPISKSWWGRIDSKG